MEVRSSEVMCNFRVIIFCVLVYSTLGEKCTTPTGQPGECVPLSSCSSLLWSFANPKSSTEEYLQKYLCASDEGSIRVCCRIPSDFLVFENEDDVTEAPDLNQLERVENMKNCGVQNNVGVKDGIINLYNFPWLVKLVRVVNFTDDTEQIVCTGVLINAWYVLYTAQCHQLLAPLDPPFYVRIDSYIGEGANCQKNSYSTACTKLILYEMESSTVHPFYDAQSKLNDIAALRLSRSVQFTDHIRPICLPIHNDKLQTGQLLFTAGWNKTFQLGDTTIKSAYSSRFILNQACQQRLAKDMINEVITTYSMCSVNPRSVNETDVIDYPTMYFHNNKWYILGFTSKSQHRNSSTVQIHSRVENYLQWFKHSMGGEQCVTPFGETGVCTHITDCPRLLEATANYAAADEDELKKFECLYSEDDPEDTYYTLKVCCGIAPNFTIFVNATEETEQQYNNLSDFTYCGLQHRDDYYSDDDRISVDEFPWLATVINATSPGQREFMCAGTLISQRHVLTSSQCSWYFNGDDTILVRLGDYNQKNGTDCIYIPQFDTYECSDIQEYGLDNHIWHPFYNHIDYINDISLLTLNKSVTFSDYVRPICLPRSEADFGKDGDTLFKTGFGDSDTDVEGAKIKKKIRTTLISNERCKDILNVLGYFTAITPYQICTEDFRNSTDVTCSGDEGGPLMYFYKFRWFVVGMTSSYACRENEPHTHLKIFKYLKWIKMNMED